MTTRNDTLLDVLYEHKLKQVSNFYVGDEEWRNEFPFTLRSKEECTDWFVQDGVIFIETLTSKYSVDHNFNEIKERPFLRNNNIKGSIVTLSLNPDAIVIERDKHSNRVAKHYIKHYGVEWFFVKRARLNG